MTFVNGERLAKSARPFQTAHKITTVARGYAGENIYKKQALPIHQQPAVTPMVSVLLFGRSPPAISRSVASRCVNSVE